MMHAKLVDRARTLLRQFRGAKTGGGNTDSPRYCYSVWLRHLVTVCGSSAELPVSVAEIGPGKSLGTGLAAMLCGADRLCAFDLLAYTDAASNIALLDQLAEMFRRREPIPDDVEFPRVLPHLGDYSFPSHLLPDELVDRMTSPARVARIKQELTRTGLPGNPIRYVAPWNDSSPESVDTAVDLVFSQAVMFYVADLEKAYATIANWMKPGGFTSHSINFTSSGLTPEWDGHWRFSQGEWKKLVGKAPYQISRHPMSAHLAAMLRAGLEPTIIERETTAPTVPSDQLAPPFAELSEADRSTSRIFVVARKKRAA